jgi:hypothetical protein
MKIESPRSKELQTKLDAAKVAAKIAQTPDGHVGLQAMRIWKIGTAGGLKGTAEFQVLLSSGGVASALPIGVVPHTMQVRIEAAKWNERYPPGVDARLAVKAMLNCHSDICEVVVEP